MTVFLTLFLATSTVLWLSVFGYVLVLGSIALFRRQVQWKKSTYPDIAIVIPTLNEENLILPKLANIQDIDYPRDRMTVTIVDGGSVDQTTKLASQKIAGRTDMQLICLNGARGKAGQINHVLGLLTQEIVIITDVDTLLEASCVRELVGALVNDPKTAVVGALVRPKTPLLEERIHWWLQGYLWWIEGEALFSALVGAPCYAFRREMILPLALNAKADDVHVALTASARGFRVRICRTALAEEVRVPQTANDFVRFRRRRGKDYLYELLCSRWNNAPVCFRIARLMRLWHLLVTPKVAVGSAFFALVLIWTPYWPIPLMALVIFTTPLLAILLSSTTLSLDGFRWSRLSLAYFRFIVLMFISMLTLDKHPSAYATLRERE